MRNYILDGKTPVACEDILKWAEWYEKAERHVAEDTVDGVRVSTVFLAMNHAFNDGPPVLFETMVFGGPLDEEQERYCTWEEAEAGHANMVARVKAALEHPHA